MNQDPMPLVDQQGAESSSSETEQSQPESPEPKDTSPTPKIPRGLAGDRVRQEIAANNVPHGLSGINKIDTFLGWATDENDSEKAS